MTEPPFCPEPMTDAEWGPFATALGIELPVVVRDFTLTTSSFLHDGRWIVNGGIVIAGEEEQRCPACLALVGHAHVDACPWWPKP